MAFIYSNALRFKILAPGTYMTDKVGAVTLNKDDLRRMADVYNRGKDGKVDGPKRKAPVVIGHPENDLPSWGEVHSLDFDESTGHITALVDPFDGLRDAMRRAIKDGSVGQHSAQFYAPDNPRNPEPNTWYLKHIGFAGPPPPVPVGTLTPDVEFAEYVKLGGPMCPDGLAIFAQYATRPKDPGTIATLALAFQDECRRRGGREISFAECVHRVMDQF